MPPWSGAPPGSASTTWFPPFRRPGSTPCFRVDGGCAPGETDRIAALTENRPQEPSGCRGGKDFRKIGPFPCRLDSYNAQKAYFLSRRLGANTSSLQFFNVHLYLSKKYITFANVVPCVPEQSNTRVLFFLNMPEKVRPQPEISKNRLKSCVVSGGILCVLEEKYLIVKFPDRESKFLYPSAFEKGNLSLPL